MASVSDVFEGFDCTIIGNAAEEVTGLAYRSDCVKPGDVLRASLEGRELLNFDIK